MSLEPTKATLIKTPGSKLNPVDQLIGDLSSAIAKPAIRNLTDTFGQFMPEAYKPDTRETGAKNNSRVTVQVEEPQKGFSFFA